MTDGEIVEALFVKGMQDERPRGFRGVAHPPIGLADPISHLGVGLLGGAIADAADQRAAAVDGEGDTFFAGLQALDPIDRHLLAIGVRDGSGHAGDLVVAGEQADARRIGEHRGAQQEFFGADGHEGRIRGRGPFCHCPPSRA